MFKKKILLIVVGSALTLAGAAMIIYSYLSPINYFILDDVVVKTEQPTEKIKTTPTKVIEKEEMKEEEPIVVEEKKAIENKPITQPVQELTVGKYYIISGSFSTEENANMHTKNLQTIGYTNAKMLGKVKSLYKVSVDEFNTREEADIKLREIKEKDQPTAWILYL